MIHSFSCENFYSFGDKMKVSFAVDNKAPQNDSYVQATPETRVSLIENVIGPNASGKTNILKVLAFMQWIIVYSSRYDPDHKIPVRPFGDNKEGQPTCVSASFSIEGRLFTYAFNITRDRIMLEKLTEKSTTEKRITSKTLFVRTWDEQTKQYDVQDKVFDIPVKRLRTNSSVVGDMFRANNELATMISVYWRDCVVTNVREFGYEGDHPKREDLAYNAIEFFHKNPGLKSRVEELLRKYDLGVSTLRQHELQGEVVYSIEHIFGKTTFEPPLKYESSGTKQLLVILRYILSALETKEGVAIIDELDANLHPEMVEAIVSMFTSKELNPNRSQLVFSSHSHRILADLDKYQIVLTEKNDMGQTEVWRLDDVKGVRSDDNYYHKYIAGAYEAVPNIG